MINKEEIKVKLGIYSCNYKKNNECKKTCCQNIDGRYGCTNTTKWKYAKRTPLNYIKRIINILRGIKNG